jgi:hypothetical protein
MWMLKAKQNFKNFGFIFCFSSQTKLVTFEKLDLVQ